MCGRFFTYVARIYNGIFWIVRIYSYSKTRIPNRTSSHPIVMACRGPMFKSFESLSSSTSGSTCTVANKSNTQCIPSLVAKEHSPNLVPCTDSAQIYHRPLQLKEVLQEAMQSNAQLEQRSSKQCPISNHPTISNLLLSMIKAEEL
jgi:hypothetical protein